MAETLEDLLRTPEARWRLRQLYRQVIDEDFDPDAPLKTKKEKDFYAFIEKSVAGCLVAESVEAAAAVLNEAGYAPTERGDLVDDAVALRETWEEWDVDKEENSTASTEDNGELRPCGLCEKPPVASPAEKLTKVVMCQSCGVMVMDTPTSSAYTTWNLLME